MIVNNKLIKKRSEKERRRVLKHAKRQIRKGHLFDSFTFGAYLHTIDNRFSHLKADINNLTATRNYDTVRAVRMAETRQMINFYEGDIHELRTYSEIVANKAKEAGRLEDLKTQRRLNIDVAKLRDEYNKLTKDKVGEEK